jgi:hypothetical protein
MSTTGTTKQRDLDVAYGHEVAVPCLKFQEDPVGAATTRLG